LRKWQKDMASQISGSFNIDVKTMARRIVTQLILEKEPNISEEHLEKTIRLLCTTRETKYYP
jgi:hypothetical protein